MVKPQHLCLAAILAIGLATPLAAQNARAKMDLALTDAVNAGCSTATVIIRTRPGYRPGLAQVLQEHGDRVATQHPSIEAVSAEVHCEDLDALAGFDEILSISIDAMVLPASEVGRAQLPKQAAFPAQARANGAKSTSDIKRPTRASADTFAIDRPGTPAKHVVPGNKGGDPDGEAAALAQSYLFETLGLKADPTAFSGAYHTATAGEGIGVAIIDSGIEPAADFDNRITHFYDFTNGTPRRARASDGYGHGTHIAGLIGGRYVGLAPNARLVGLRVLNNKGQGRTSDVISAIEFAAANHERLGISAINLSLGHPIYEPAATDPLVQAVEAAVRAGLIVITAAGNFGINPETGEPGYAGVISPGNAPSAITAGALQTFGTAARGDDRVAPYSSRGPTWHDAFAKPDVVAPAHNVLSVAARNSLLDRTHKQMGGTGGYMHLSGTSMAAAVTSGMVALVLNTNPGLTPNTVKMVLQFSATPIRDDGGRLFDALTQGTGGLNGDGALVLAGIIDTTQPYGATWAPAGLPTYSMIAGEPHDWAGSIIWGGHSVTGAGLIEEHYPAWHRNIVWGTFRDESDNIVWGTWRDGETDNIVWGTLRSDEGDNIVWGTWHDELDNIVWGTLLREGDNIVWGTFFRESDNIVWGTNIVWGGFFGEEGDNILWGTNIVWGASLFGIILDEIGDNIVWGTVRDLEGDNIVWGTSEEFANIVWGTWFEADNVVWGTLYDFNIVWGNVRDLESDNVVWGTVRDFVSDNVVWGTSVMWGDTIIAGARPKHGQAGKE